MHAPPVSRWNSVSCQCYFEFVIICVIIIIIYAVSSDWLTSSDHVTNLMKCSNEVTVGLWQVQMPVSVICGSSCVLLYIFVAM